jgi:hypothetical protein
MTLLTPSGVHDWMFTPTEELVLPRGSTKRIHAAEQLRRYGSVFASYRASHFWYFNVEVVFAAITGMSTGLMLRAMGGADPCEGAGWAWAVVSLGMVETVLALLLRAYALRLELVVFVLVMFFTILSEVVVLADASAASAANALSVIAAVLQVLSMMYGACEHLLLRHRVTRLSAFVAETPDSVADQRRDAAPSDSAFMLLHPPPPRPTRETQSRPALGVNSPESTRVRNALADMIEMICDQ